MPLNFNLTGIANFKDVCYDTRTDPPPTLDRPGPCPKCGGPGEIIGAGEDGRIVLCFDCDHRHSTFRVFVDCSPNPWSPSAFTCARSGCERTGEPTDDDDQCPSPDCDGLLKPVEWARRSAVTYVLIWKALSLDLGSITADNVDEWMLRLRLHSAFHGDEPCDLITTTEKTLEDAMSGPFAGLPVATIHKLLAEGWEPHFVGPTLDVQIDFDAFLRVDNPDDPCLKGADAARVIRTALEGDRSAILFRKRTARALTRAEVEAHIGLTTNVTTVKRHKWLKSMSAAHDCRIEWAKE